MAWTDLHAKVHQTFKQRGLLTKGKSAVLGLSGGQDSLCLLAILRDLQPKWGWRIAVVHCNHRWPPDSNLNADHVAAIAQRWELEHYCFTAPKVLKGEAEGRTWRYQVLSELAHQQQFDAVITAHTASDRAETLLYNLLRGSGMDGLQALSWQRPLSERVQLIRPLLTITRQQTADFCQQLNLPVWQDSMNQDLTYRRNQIRLELLPWLNQNFNPQVETALSRTAEILQAETSYLNAQAQMLLNHCRIQDEFLKEALSALDCVILQESPVALQRRAIRLWLRDCLDIQPNFEQIEKTVALIHGSNGERSDPFIKDTIAEVRQSWLCLVQPGLPRL